MKALVRKVSTYVARYASAAGELSDLGIIAQYRRLSQYGLTGFGTAAVYASPLGSNRDREARDMMCRESKAANTYARGFAGRSENAATIAEALRSHYLSFYSAMNERHKSRLRHVIATSFPGGARVIGIPRQTALVLAISWMLPKNAGRRSKTIRLAVSKEIVDLYIGAAREDQLVTESLIQSALAKMLLEFDPARAQSAIDWAEIVHWQLGLEN